MSEIDRISRDEVKALWGRRDTLTPLEVRCLSDLGWKHVAMAQAETDLMHAKRTIKRLRGVPAIRMAMGGSHTENCDCPLCEADAYE